MKVASKSCGVLETTHDLRRTGQIYEINCGIVGRWVELLATPSNTFRFSEIEVKRGTGELAFLAFPYNSFFSGILLCYAILLLLYYVGFIVQFALWFNNNTLIL